MTLEILPLSRDYDYPQSLARGEVDLVIGNWLRPPAELHLGRLMADEVVCLVARRLSGGEEPAPLDRRALPAGRACRADRPSTPARSA